MGELSDRRAYTVERVKTLREKLKDAETIAKGKACVYATGSFGRCEACKYSDLDLFIVGKKDGNPGPDGKEGSQLKQLDEICIKAELIQVTRSLIFPEFSGDGRWLIHYSAHEFTKTLGAPEDDVTNTFTARLLLLLESCALIGKHVYHEVNDDVIAAYWRDYEDHKSDFMPAFLANDILRLWRTFCVNYEARTDRDPEAKKAKRKVKNYKLKHSMLLTCYSAILYLLAIYKKSGTVSPQNALDMIELTPTHRLEWLAKQNDLYVARKTLFALLEQYEQFLSTTNVAEETLVERFLDKTQTRDLMAAASNFGDLIYQALTEIGGNNAFHRKLVV